MGRMQRELRFSIITDKYEHWSPEHLKEWEEGDASPDDYVISKLEIVMREAGEQFIRENPDLFYGELM